MKNIKKFETFLPVFPGFYNTIFDTDYEMERYIESEEQEGIKVDVENIYDKFNYSNYGKDVIEQCCEVLKDECDFISDIQLQAVINPKEYNFHNDSANVEITLDVEELRFWIGKHWELVKKYIEDHYTSYDGFWSSYPNDIKEWATITKSFTDYDANSHMLGALLGVYFEYIGFTEETLYNSIEVWESVMDGIYAIDEV